MLSNQALKCGEESGHHNTQENAYFLSMDTTYYQDVWEPAAGEKFHAEEEFDIPMDKYCREGGNSNS